MESNEFDIKTKELQTLLSNLDDVCERATKNSLFSEWHGELLAKTQDLVNELNDIAQKEGKPPVVVDYSKYVFKPSELSIDDLVETYDNSQDVELEEKIKFYTYYKDENKKLKEKIKSLEEELKSQNAEEKMTTQEKFRQEYGRKCGFCKYGYVNHFLEPSFEDDLKNVTKHLDYDSQKFFKWLLIRNITSNIATRENLYLKSELSDQERFIEFKKTQITDDGVAEYKFSGGYNLHPFIDLNLTKEDEEFLKNKDIIDAGAYTGDTSLPLAKITSKNVYAFEPFEKSFELLKKNISDNEINNIVPVNKSLGNFEGERTLYLAGNNAQGITSDPNARNYDREIKIQETTIDKFVKENDLNVGFITIDVEGAELDLLNGAIETIKSQKPILSISIYHKLSDYFNIIPWVADLNLGYEFKIVKEQPWAFFSDVCVQCRVKSE